MEESGLARAFAATTSWREGNTQPANSHSTGCLISHVFPARLLWLMKSAVCSLHLFISCKIKISNPSQNSVAKHDTYCRFGWEIH